MDPFKLARLNKILKTELGEDPLYCWLHTRSPKWRRPVEVWDQSASPPRPIYDYHCACGKNVSIHKPSCKSLSAAMPRYEMAHVFEALPNMRHYIEQDAYLIGVRQFYSVESWRLNYGSMPYSSHLYWHATIDGHGGPIITKPGRTPNESVTYAVIHMVREHRSYNFSQLADEWEAAEEKRHLDNRNEIRDTLNEFKGLRPFPGKVDGNVSLPTVTIKSKNRAKTAPSPVSP